MKRLIMIFICLALAMSCSNDDNDANDTIVLTGTTWVGTGATDSSRNITFHNDIQFIYHEPGGNETINGNYTVTGNQGILEDAFGTIPFSVANDILTIDYDGAGGAYADTTGTETFLRQ